MRAVRRLCPGWLAARQDDLVQNACVRILRKLEKEGKQARLAASYVWRVAHSVIMDEIRHDRRHTAADPVTPGIMEPPSNLPSPEQNSDAVTIRHAINEGLRGLSEPRRWAVLLYLYGFSLKDSARMLGWKAKRVDNQRHQGLVQLRAYLRQRGMEP